MCAQALQMHACTLQTQASALKTLARAYKTLARALQTLALALQILPHMLQMLACAHARDPNARLRARQNVPDIRPCIRARMRAVRSHDLGVSTFPWGRVMDTREKESSLAILRPQRCKLF
ncbi:hypothetical protein CRG98_045801 [Punica granatum]|uniref:Uncharacterized protein n=1 Tax=Punica granatum TaxID=22663 RepID=A0A2I0HRC1_PUNGR|nr:hypothetical protein CRG98_045801 [Punica granatum]